MTGRGEGGVGSKGGLGEVRVELDGLEEGSKEYRLGGLVGKEREGPSYKSK